MKRTQLALALLLLTVGTCTAAGQSAPKPAAGAATLRLDAFVVSAEPASPLSVVALDRRLPSLGYAPGGLQGTTLLDTLRPESLAPERGKPLPEVSVKTLLKKYLTGK